MGEPESATASTDVFAGPRGDLLKRLCDASAQLEPDALEVLVLIAERALMGLKSYGPLVLSKDKRDLVRETLFEHIDATFYMGAEAVRWLRSRIAKGVAS